MMSRRPFRRFVAILAGTAMLSALFGQAVVLAKPPSWVGNPVQLLPPVVQAGDDAGYQVSVRNDGPSNISQLYLITDGPAPDPSYTAPSQGTCNGSGPLFCSLGALGAGQTATVIVAFPVPANASGSFDVTFEWNTTGLGSGGPANDNSHGDAVIQPVSTEISGDSTNYAGGFVVPGDSSTTANDQSVGRTNRMTTLVITQADGIAVTVEDGPGVDDPGCPAPFSCFGETAEIHVGDGTASYGTQTVVIQIDGSDVRPGVNKNNLQVIHVPTVGDPYEITDTCARRNPTPECKTVENIPGGGFKVTLLLNSNGFIKFG